MNSEIQSASPLDLAGVAVASATPGPVLAGSGPPAPTGAPSCVTLEVATFACPSWPKWLKATSGASGCVGTTARACPLLLPLCFVLRWLPWSTHESISDCNCSTSLHHFIISSSSYTTRRVPLNQRERERVSLSSDLLTTTATKAKSKKKKANGGHWVLFTPDPN